MITLSLPSRGNGKERREEGGGREIFCLSGTDVNPSHRNLFSKLLLFLNQFYLLTSFEIVGFMFTRQVLSNLKPYTEIIASPYIIDLMGKIPSR